MRFVADTCFHVRWYEVLNPVCVVIVSMQLAELQQLLEIQKNAFREHLGRGDANASAMAAAAAAAAQPSAPAQSNAAAQPLAQPRDSRGRAAPIAGFLGGRGQPQPEKDISLSTFDGKRNKRLY
jgi:hypothetical protein